MLHDAHGINMHRPFRAEEILSKLKSMGRLPNGFAGATVFISGPVGKNSGYAHYMEVRKFWRSYFNGCGATMHWFNFDKVTMEEEMRKLLYQR